MPIRAYRLRPNETVLLRTPHLGFGPAPTPARAARTAILGYLLCQERKTPHLDSPRYIQGHGRYLCETRVGILDERDPIQLALELGAAIYIHCCII